MDHGAFAMSVDSFSQRVDSSQTNNILSGSAYSRPARETEPAAPRGADAPLSLVTSPVAATLSSSEPAKISCASVSTVSGLVSGGAQHRIVSVPSLSSQPSKTIVVMPVSAAGVIAAGQQIVKRVKTE